MVADRTSELWDEADAGYFPAPARAQMERSLAGQSVLDYYLSAEQVVGSESGVTTQVRVAVLTPNRLIHTVWWEDTDDEDEPNLSLQLEQLLGSQPGDDTERGEVSEQATLTVSTRTTTLRQIVDVQTTTHHASGVSVDDTYPDLVTVLVLSPTLNSLSLTPVTCGDTACTGEHPTEGRAQQDAIGLEASLARDGAAAMARLLRFAASLEAALP